MQIKGRTEINVPCWGCQSVNVGSGARRAITSPHNAHSDAWQDSDNELETAAPSVLRSGRVVHEAKSVWKFFCFLILNQLFLAFLQSVADLLDFLRLHDHL